MAAVWAFCLPLWTPASGFHGCTGGERRTGPPFRNNAVSQLTPAEPTEDRGLALSHRLIISLSLGLSLFASAATSPVAFAAESPNPQPEIVSEEAENLLSTEEVEAKVREYWKDAPVMAKVAYCESTFRHFNEDGQPLRGHVNKADVGVMQINETVHKASAEKMGLNLETLDGNLAYARHLYRTQGTAPWVYSSHCWQA